MIWKITPTHGVHLGDLPVALVWAVGMVACALLGRRARPAAAPPDPTIEPRG